MDNISIKIIKTPYDVIKAGGNCSGSSGCGGCGGSCACGTVGNPGSCGK